MNRSTPGLPVHHQPIESVMPSSHLVLCHSPPAPNPSQHQGLYFWFIFLLKIQYVPEKIYEGTHRSICPAEILSEKKKSQQNQRLKLNKYTYRKTRAKLVSELTSNDLSFILHHTKS